MYRYFSHKDIDYKLWDNCISNSIHHNVYCLSWYLDCVCEEWDALITVENDNYVTVCPLPIKFKLGVRLLYTPVFCNQLGMSSIRPISQDNMKHFLRALVEHFRYISNYHLNVFDSRFLPYSISMNAVSYCTYQIDLSRPYKEILNGLSSDRKKNIKKSYRFNSIIEESSELDVIISFFKESVESKIIGGVGDRNYEILKRLFIVSSRKGLSKLYIVKNSEDQTISGCWLIIYKNSIIKFFNASNEEGRMKNADSLLMDHFFKIYSNKGLIFDLERESLPGVNRYKESYNPSRFTYNSLFYNDLPGYVEVFKRFRNLLFYIKRVVN